MENIRLACIRKERLINKGWSERAAYQIKHNIAPSTQATYDCYVNKLLTFCKTHQIISPLNRPETLSKYFCEIADKSTKPKGVVDSAAASLKAMYKPDGIPVG